MVFLQKNGTVLFKLFLTAWFLTNTICLMSSSTPFLTLAFVNEISFFPYCVLWSLLFAGCCFLWYGPRKMVSSHVTLMISIALYITTILMKEMVLV